MSTAQRDVCRADASKFEKGDEVVWIERAAEAFSVEAFCGSFVGAEQVEGDAAQGGEVGGGVPGAGAAAVFLEAHIEAPVELVFHAPVAAHGAGEPPDVRRQAAEVVAAFGARCAAGDFAHGFDHRGGGGE